MQQGKRSQDVKSSFDVTDDLEHATALSYTSHIPLNDRNAARSTTSLNPQHGDDPSQTQVDREDGDPQQVYFDSHSQNQRPQHPRGSSWDLLGGARKINEAYEQFDSRNASEQHLVFADGDLPNSKVSHRLLFLGAHGSKNGWWTDGDQFVRFYQFLLSASIVTRWTLFIIPVLAILWIPGIIGLTTSPRGEVRCLFHSGCMVMWEILFTIFVDMGSPFDMVEHMAKRRLGRYAYFIWFLASFRSNFAGWWACLAGAYVSFCTLRLSKQFLSAIFFLPLK